MMTNEMKTNEMKTFDTMQKTENTMEDASECALPAPAALMCANSVGRR